MIPICMYNILYLSCYACYEIFNVLVIFVGKWFRFLPELVYVKMSSRSNGPPEVSLISLRYPDVYFLLLVISALSFMSLKVSCS